MEEIVNSIRGVTVMMSEISAASTEQTAGIEQVNQAITQMDDVTQQNAALVEQAAAAAESLEEQAQNLSDTVAQFKVDGYSRHAHGAVSQATLFSCNTASQTKRHKRQEQWLTKNRQQPSPQPIQQSSSDEWEEF